MVEALIVRLSGSRRVFAPLALVVGGFVMLFTGLKLLFTNWRLTLVQILPAMWIWLAMYDLKAHALHGKTFHVLRGPILIPIVLVITAITAASSSSTPCSGSRSCNPAHRRFGRRSPKPALTSG